MALVNELLGLETRFWTEGADYFRAHVDDQAMVAFGTLAGTLDNNSVASSVGGGPRWEAPKIQVKGCLEPTRGFALLTYRAEARNPDGQSYSAIVSSGYVDRNGSWKLAFHQHTPIEAGA